MVRLMACPSTTVLGSGTSAVAVDDVITVVTATAISAALPAGAENSSVQVPGAGVGTVIVR